jgi:hypothetical protein
MALSGDEPVLDRAQQAKAGIKLRYGLATHVGKGWVSNLRVIDGFRCPHH